MPQQPLLHRPRRIALAALAALGLALPAQPLSALGLVVDNGNTLSFAGGVYAGNLQLLNGTLLIQHDADLSLSGNQLVNGVVTLANSGTPSAVLRFAGDTHMSGSGLVAFQSWADTGPGSLQVTNAGHWTQDANTLLGLGRAALFSNLSGATWEMVGSAYAATTLDVGADGQTNRFSNEAGALLLKTGDGQASLVGNLFNTGTVRAEQGQLVLYGIDLHSDALLQGQGGEVVLNGQHSFQGQNLLQGSVSFYDASSATVMAGGLLRVGDGLLTNDGTLSVLGELRVDAGASLANAGTLRYGTDLAGNNGLINVQGSLSNAGTLSADRLQLDGHLTNAGLVVAHQINGAGLLDNPGSFDLQVNGSGLLAGLINSGQVSLEIGSALTLNSRFINVAGGQVFLTNASLTLASGGAGSNGGTLSLDSASVLVLNGSLANAGTLAARSTDGQNNMLQLNAGAELHNLAGGSINADVLQVYAGGLVVNEAGASLVASQVSVDPGASVVSEGSIQVEQQWIHLGSLALRGSAVLTSTGQFSNGGAVTLSGGASFVNQGGNFDMSAPGASLTVGSGTSFVNNGVMTVMGGASLAVDAGGSLINNYSGGPLTLEGSARLDGSLLNAAGARVVMQGQLQGQGLIDNQGQLLVGAGAWVAVDQLRNTGQVRVMADGRNPQADGMLAVSRISNLNGAELRVEGRLSLAGPQALSNEAAARVIVAGRVESDTSAVVANAGRLELLPGAGWSGGGQLTNTGSLIVGAGAALAVDRLDSQAGLLTVDGSLDTGAGVTLTLSGGVLNGNGLINGDVFVGGGSGLASFRPGHSPGHFTINGALAVGANGELELQVQRLADGSLAWDRVSAASISFLDGATVRFEIGAGVATRQAQTLGFLDCGSGCNFASGVHWVIDGAPAGTTLAFTSSGLQLNVSAVPEPATLLLWLAGLVVLGAGRARARR